ncbi:hypothetical protein [Plantactinospora sp. WMMB782]
MTGTLPTPPIGRRWTFPMIAPPIGRRWTFPMTTPPPVDTGRSG